MVIRLKKIIENNKGIRTWFVLAVIMGAIWYSMKSVHILVPLFAGDFVRYVALIVMIVAMFMLMLGLEPDSSDYKIFKLLDRFKTDVLAVIVLSVFEAVTRLCRLVCNMYSDWMWNVLIMGIRSTVYALLLFLMIVPATFVMITLWVMLVRRIKDKEKRMQWIARDYIDDKNIKYFDYERKSKIRTIVFVVINLLAFLLIFYSISEYEPGAAAMVIPVLAVDTLFYFTKNKFYNDVGEIARELKHMSEGEKVQSVNIKKSSPLYETACDLSKVNDSLDFSVKRQIKSEQMKVELITNVSHDLKTPLTSIIGYIDLLKKETLSPEARDYVDVISSKSEHLKEMIQDLFEISKATSGNAELVMEKLDMVKLIEQTLGDMEDRIAGSGRTIRTSFPETSLYISGDGRKLYRVYQNLIENALKYSMNGTRIYVDAELKDEKVVTTIKNISAYEMDFTADKIVERFQRGDENRTTEGHGLGLAIVKSFSEACGGHMDIVIDGDMFKAIIAYPVYKGI